MKFETPQAPNVSMLSNGNIWLFWVSRFFDAFKRVDANYERVTRITADYDALTTDCLILCDATSGNITVTLPAQTDLGFNKKYIIRQIDSSANTVTIATADSAAINTAITVPLTSQWATITLISNLTDWEGF